MGIQVTKPASSNNLDIYNSGVLVGSFATVDFRGPNIDVSNNASSGTVLINISGGTDATKYAQSGETRNLITSGGIVAQGTISGATLHFTDTIVTSGIIVDDISADVIMARSVTTSGLTVKGAATVSGAVNAYGVSLFQAGLVANAAVSGLHVTASGLNVGGIATVGGVNTDGTVSGSIVNVSGLAVGGLSTLTGGVSVPGAISGLSVTASGLVVDGSSSGTSLNLTSGLVADILSGRFVNASGLSVDGPATVGSLATAGIISGLSVTTSGLVSNGPISGTSVTLTSGLISDGVAASILSGKSLTLTSGLIADGVTANIISGKSLVLTSGIVADTISGVVIGASSGFVGNAQSGHVLTSVASGSLAVWSAPAGGTDATKYAQSGETRNLITSGGIAAEGTFSGRAVTITSGLIAADVISGNINAGLINAGRLILPRLPDGSTSGEAIVAQGTGLDPVWAAVTADTTALYAQSGEVRNLVTSGAIFAMGGYLSGDINADLVNAGRFSLSRLPDGSTSGHALLAQGAGIDPLYAAQVVTDTSHLYAQSGETRNLVTSGGIVVETLVSSRAVTLTSGLNIGPVNSSGDRADFPANVVAGAMWFQSGGIVIGQGTLTPMANRAYLGCMASGIPLTIEVNPVTTYGLKLVKGGDNTNNVATIRLDSINNQGFRFEGGMHEFADINGALKLRLITAGPMVEGIGGLTLTTDYYFPAAYPIVIYTNTSSSPAQKLRMTIEAGDAGSNKIISYANFINASGYGLVGMTLETDASGLNPGSILTVSASGYVKAIDADNQVVLGYSLDQALSGQPVYVVTAARKSFSAWDTVNAGNMVEGKGSVGANIVCSGADVGQILGVALGTAGSGSAVDIVVWPR